MPGAAKQASLFERPFLRPPFLFVHSFDFTFD